MLHLIPEELFAVAQELACYGFMVLTAMVSYLLVPKT